MHLLIPISLELSNRGFTKPNSADYEDNLDLYEMEIY